MKRTSMILIMSMWAGTSAFAMTLDDAISAALNHENQLKISGLGVNQAEAMLQQAQKRNGANVNLAGQIGIEKVDSNDPSNPFFPIDGLRRPRALELQFDYPIYTSGRKSLGVEVAKMQLKAQNQAFSGQTATTILQTVQVYTDVLKQQALLRLKQQVLQNLKQSLSDAQKRFKAGVITRADLAQVQSQNAQGQADVVLAQSNLDISSAQFFQVTGQTPEQLQMVRFLPSVPDDLDQVLQQVSNHPLIQQAKFEQQAAEKQYKLVKRELTPTVNLTSRIGKQNEIVNFDAQSDNYMVGLQVNVPIFDQGLNRANRQKAQVDVNLAFEKIQAVEQNLGKRAQTTFAQLQAVRQNKQALNEAIDAAALAYRFIQRELEFGTKTTFDALTAEQTLQDLQTQQLLNEQDEVLLVYQLLDQMGQLSSSRDREQLATSLQTPTRENLPIQSRQTNRLFANTSAASRHNNVNPITATPVAFGLQSSPQAAATQVKQAHKTNHNFTANKTPVVLEPTQGSTEKTNLAVSSTQPKPEITINSRQTVLPLQSPNIAISKARRSWYLPWSWFAKPSPLIAPRSSQPMVKTTVLPDNDVATPIVQSSLPSQSLANQSNTTPSALVKTSHQSVYKPWTWFSSAPKQSKFVASTQSQQRNVTPLNPTQPKLSQRGVESNTSVKTTADLTNLQLLQQVRSSTQPTVSNVAQKQPIISDANTLNLQQELAALPSEPIMAAQSKPRFWQKLTVSLKKQPKVKNLAPYQAPLQRSPNLTERVRYRPVVSEQK